jgi:di/tricarboxylate transporter
MTLDRKGGWTLGALAAGLAVLLLLALTQRLPAADARIIGIVYTCVLLWATAAIPGYLVSLLFFLLATVLTAVPPSEIFSGFASSAFWLVFSGGVIGVALKDSGLSQRIGAILARRIGRSYLKALFAFAVLSFALSLIMPSTFGRVAILVPIAIGYCQVAGLDRSGRGQNGILLLVIVGSYELAAAVLPANLPNVIMSGILEQSAGIHLSFSEYLTMFFPAGVLVRGAILIGVSYRLFPDRVEADPPAPHTAPLSRQEVRVLILLSATLALWLTDSLHRIAPGWVGLGFSLAYLLTSSRQQVTAFADSYKMDLLWFIAAIIGLTALINHIDLGMLSSLAGSDLTDQPLLAYAALIGVSIALCFVVTSNAEPALFTPFAMRLLGHGALLKMGLLSQVMGYSTTFLPYQSPPIVFGTDLAKLDRGAVVRYCLVTAVLGVVFVMPLNAAWWWLIGLL